MRLGLFSALSMGVLRDPNPPVPAGGGGTTPPAPPVPGQPFAVFETQEAFNDRLHRSTRAELRAQFGTDDPAEIKTQLARLKVLEEADAARAREQLTATQKLELDLAAEKTKREAAEAERDQERFRATVSQDCARLGIKNLKYAQFVVAEAAEALPEGQQLDPYEHLKGLLEKPEFKPAFGIESAPTVVPTPVNTSPTPGAPPPPPPPAGGGPGGPDVMAMSAAEFRAHLDRQGVQGLSVQ